MNVEICEMCRPDTYAVPAQDGGQERLSDIYPVYSKNWQASLNRSAK